jgi:hypothetical protein
MMDYSEFEKFLISERINRSTGGGASYGQGITGTDQAAAFSDDMGLDDEAYEQFAEVANPGFNMGFAKQIGRTALSGILGAINPFAGAISGITGFIGRTGLPSAFNTFGQSKTLAEFARTRAQQKRDKIARETAAMRGSVKGLQGRIDRGEFDGDSPDDAPGGPAANQDAAREGQYG